MTAALVALAITAALGAGSAVLLALRMTGMKAEIVGLEGDASARAIAYNALHAEMLRHKIAKARQLERYRNEISSLNAELQICGDEDARGRAAVLGLSRLFKLSEDPTDPGH